MNCGVPCAQCMSFNKGSRSSCCAYPGQRGLKRPGSAGESGRLEPLCMGTGQAEWAKLTQSRKQLSPQWGFL